MNRKIYSGKLKAEIVLKLISNEADLTTLSNLYHIHPNLIKNWKSKFLREAHTILEDKRKNRGD